MSFLFIISIFLMLSIGACGKKSKNIFHFSDLVRPKNRRIQVNLPGIHNITLKNLSEKKVLVIWDPIKPQSLQDCICVGYNLYKISLSGVVNKTPFNQTIINTSKFIIQKNALSRLYLIRAVFKYKDNIVFGPASKVFEV